MSVPTLSKDVLCRFKISRRKICFAWNQNEILSFRIKFKIWYWTQTEEWTTLKTQLYGYSDFPQRKSKHNGKLLQWSMFIADTLRRFCIEKKERPLFHLKNRDRWKTNFSKIKDEQLNNVYLLISLIFKTKIVLF